MKKFAWLGLFMLVAVVLTGMTFAEESKIPGGVKGILNGVLGGAIAVFLGWGKNKDPQSGKMESFDVKYAWPTLIIGAVVGLIAHWMNLTPKDLLTSVEASPIFAGAVLALEMLWKMVFRHSVPLIRETVNAIKGGGGNPS